MTEYYEVHITMIGDSGKIKSLVESVKWKYSAIDGDIILGDGVKCYATTHYSTSISTDDSVRSRLEDVAKILIDAGVNVIRKKIERVIYDSKQESCISP